MIIHEKKYKGLFISSIRTEHVREMTKKIMQKSGNAKIYVLTGCDGDKSENVHSEYWFPSIQVIWNHWFSTYTSIDFLLLLSYFLFISDFQYNYVISKFWFECSNLFTSAVQFLIGPTVFRNDNDFKFTNLNSNQFFRTSLSVIFVSFVIQSDSNQRLEGLSAQDLQTEDNCFVKLLVRWEITVKTYSIAVKWTDIGSEHMLLRILF